MNRELIGITRTMKCGVSGTIIWASEDGKSINVQFKNGVIMNNRKYNSFYYGCLNPTSSYRDMCSIGDKIKTKQGDVAIIINMIDSRKILIEFQDEHRYQKYVAHKEIKNKNIFNPYHKGVYNVGYLGMEIPKYADKLYNKCYASWHGMIERCYCDKTKIKKPTYLECKCLEEWKNYSEFKRWFDENYYEIDDERMCLDKDILIKGNKFYSPDTCIFVPNAINVLFTKTNKFRGKYPIGVYYKKKLNRYVAQCSEIQKNGKKAQTHIGVFDTPEEAFYAYKSYKEKVIKEVADKYKEFIPNKLYEALCNWEVQIDD